MPPLLAKRRALLGPRQNPFFEYGEAKGLYRGERSRVLETNAAMNNALRNLGLTLYKRNRLYDRAL